LQGALLIIIGLRSCVIGGVFVLFRGVLGSFVEDYRGERRGDLPELLLLAVL